MKEKFKIYINDLKHGQTKTLNETVPPNLLDVQEQALSFHEMIHVRGEIYLADDHLMIHLNIHTSVFIPCSICNESVRVPIALENFYIPKPLSEIKSAIFNVFDEIRESIILQVPQFAECGEGQCPNRKKVQKFLEKISEKKKSHPIHFPFAILDDTKI